MSKKSRTEELDLLSSICQDNLQKTDTAKDYFEKRGLSDKTIKLFRLGLFPKNIFAMYRYVSKSTLLSCNIVNEYDFSRFSDTHQIIFPVFNEYGDVVGIKGRTLLSSEERKELKLPKYLGSSYKKKEVLYGFEQARKHIISEDSVYIVEGNIDFLKMYQSGIKNVVAVCGTSFTSQQFVKLLRYTRNLNFVYDRDDGGMASMKRISDKFSGRGAKIRFFTVPEGYNDVDDYLSSWFNSKNTFVEDIEQLYPSWQSAW